MTQIILTNSSRAARELLLMLAAEQSIVSFSQSSYAIYTELPQLRGIDFRGRLVFTFDFFPEHDRKFEEMLDYAYDRGAVLWSVSDQPTRTRAKWSPDSARTPVQDRTFVAAPSIRPGSKLTS